MSTGYTYKIEKGQSFENFALNCARNFGACISLRDEPGIAEAPRKIKADTHFEETRMQNAIDEKKAFEMLSDTQIEHILFKQNMEEIRRYHRYIQENRELEEKYKNMLDKVNKWTPPTSEHINLKNFMISQIEESISFDCGIIHYESEIQRRKNSSLDVEGYKKMRLEMLKKDIKRANESLKKAKKSIDDKNEWLEQLYISLGK